MPRRTSKGHPQVNLYIPTLNRNRIQKMYPELSFNAIVNRVLSDHIRNNYDTYLRKQKQDKRMLEIEGELNND